MAKREKAQNKMSDGLSEEAIETMKTKVESAPKVMPKLHNVYFRYGREKNGKINKEYLIGRIPSGKIAFIDEAHAAEQPVKSFEVWECEIVQEGSSSATVKPVKKVGRSLNAQGHIIFKEGQPLYDVMSHTKVAYVKSVQRGGVTIEIYQPTQEERFFSFKEAKEYITENRHLLLDN